MAFYSVNLVAYGCVVVEADSEDEAQMAAMDADVSRFTIDEARDAELLKTTEEIDRCKRHGAEVLRA